MKENYGSRPEDIRVAVSPSLGPCCSQFKDWNTLLPQEFHPFMPRENYVDFWAVTEKQLAQSGIRKENIYNPSICTVCSTDFFSYRRDGITGRCATVIMLKYWGLFFSYLYSASREWKSTVWFLAIYWKRPPFLCCTATPNKNYIFWQPNLVFYFLSI